MGTGLLEMGDLEAKIGDAGRFNGKLGTAFFTQYDNLLIPLDEKDRDTALETCITYAKELGYDKIEVAAHIADPNLRDPTGDTLSLATIPWTAERKDKIQGWLDKSGIGISSLACYDNMLHDDLETRTKNIIHLKKVIDAAGDLGVEYVGTFAGRNMNKPGTGQWDEFEAVFTDLVGYAKDKGVKLMFENCPMEGWRDGVESNVQSISHSPENWIKMFDIMKKNDLDGWLGLNYDPSHLVWQDIDPIEVLYALQEAGHADKIFHVHAKDIKINRARQRAQGNLGQGEAGWNLPYEHKVPGTVEYRDGGVDGIPSPREYRESVYWPAFVSALRDIGYKGVISFEHEDHGSYKTAKLDETQAQAAKSDPNVQRLADSVLRKEALDVAQKYLSKTIANTAESRLVINFETYEIGSRLKPAV